MTDRVDKRLGLSLLKRPAKAAGPIIRTGVTRMGTVGVEIEHKGVKGWGASESAARANLEQNRAMGNGVSVGKRVTDNDVAKGFLTQSTKPVLARTTPAAGRMLARPTGKVVKANVSKLGLMSAGKLIPKVAGAGWKAGRTGQKARMSIGTMGALKQSAGLRAVGTGAKMAGEHPVATGLGTGIVGGSVLGAGFAHRQVEKKANLCSRCKAPLERNAKRCMNCGKRVEVVEKGAGAEMLGNFIGGVRAVGARRALQAEGSAFKASAKEGYRQSRTPLRMPYDYRKRSALRAGEQAYKASIKRSGVGKAYGDPEDARYFRLGAGSAVLGGSGLAGLALGGRQIARDTKRERNRFKDVHDIDLPTKPHFDPATHKPGGPQEAKLRGWQKMERAKTVVADAKNTKRLKGAVVIHGRAAGLLGGGAAALGGAEMLRRRASERRYN